MKKRSGPFFRSAAALRQAAEGYFRSLEGVKALDDEGAPMYDKSGAAVMAVAERPPTVSGLALALGFSSRRELLDYRGGGVYGDIIQNALSRIEQYAEERLFDKGQYSGAKFFLANNFPRWSDKQDSAADDTMDKLDMVLKSLSAAMGDGGDH